MADPNAFPNKELEDLNKKIEDKVKNILDNLDLGTIDTTIKNKLKDVNKTLVEKGIIKPHSLCSFVPS